MTATERLEQQVAEEVLDGLPGEAAQIVSQDHDTIRFRLKKGRGWKLASIIFSRESLRNLARDLDREIKIQYLRRDIVRSAKTRRTYMYPHSIAMRTA